ncbi:hypothetical protein DTO207G8_2165 [Paecilomyces variotii]|nr:hypothetical protein DTO207G8_2165 [Paecilomyces variotii]
MASQISWIGLGNMGRGMCKNIIEKGSLQSPLIVYNRTAARAHSLVESFPKGKATVATTIADAVKPADLIFICVGDDAASDNVIKEAIESGDVKGKLFVDCSTVHPDTTRKTSQTLTEKGASFVSCPVFGAPAFADAGQLVSVLAGKKEDVDKVKPFTTGVTSRTIIDLSDQEIGRASMLKVLGNSFILSTIETLSEGLVLAEKSGLGTDTYHQWLELFFPGAFPKYSTRMTSGDYYQREYPLFAVDLARKDLRHALSLASSSGVHLPSAEVADGLLKEVKEHDGEKGDVAGIYGALRQHSGLKYENQ